MLFARGCLILTAVAITFARASENATFDVSFNATLTAERRKELLMETKEYISQIIERFTINHNQEMQNFKCALI